MLNPVRTNNRIRSPRLKTSGEWNKAIKGSRQIRPVPSVKGLAPRAAPGVILHLPLIHLNFGLRCGLPGCGVYPFSLGLTVAGGLALAVYAALAFSNSRLAFYQPTWNCDGHGESDCLIKTQLCDGLKKR